MTLSFLLTALIVVASPGTGVLYTLAVALTQGGRASIAAAFGCTLGILPHMMAAMLGLAAVLQTGALAVDTRTDGSPQAGRSSRKVIVTAVLINILNPKLSIFFLAFLPQFIAVDEAYPLARMLELSGVFMAMTFAVFALYGLFAAGVRDRVITRPRVMAWLRRSFAAGFEALGAKLAFAER